MADSGTTFQIDVGVQAAGVAPAAHSLEELTGRLRQTGSASEAMAQKLKDAEDSYAKAETAALKAAKAVDAVSQSAIAARGKLAAAISSGDSAAIDKAWTSLEKFNAQQVKAGQYAEKTKQSLAEQAALLDKVRATAKKAGDTEEGFEFGSMRALKRGLNEIGGPLGTAGAQAAALREGWQKLEASLGAYAGITAAVVGVAAITAVVIALTVKIGESIVQLGIWAVGLRDVAATNLRLAEGFAHSVEGGKKLDSTMAAILAKAPTTREELNGIANTLAQSGLRGDALAAALDRAAGQAARLKFGPEWRTEMLTMDRQTQLFTLHLSRIFGGLHIDRFEEAFSKIVALFDETSVTGQAIKVVFESLFQPLIDGVTAFVPKMVSAFIQFEIWVLKALIFIKPFGSYIVLVGEAFLAVAAILATVVVAAIVFVGASVALILAPLFIAVAAVYGLVKAFEAVKTWLGNVSLAELGANMIQGLVDGIKGAGHAVVESVTNVVSDAVDAAKKKLGISSPSKVFAEIGENTGAGMQQGIDASAPGVQDSMSAMSAPGFEGVAAPTQPVAPKAAAASSGSSADLSGATFNFYGVQGAEDSEHKFSEILTRILEGDAAQLGTQSPAGAT